MHYFRNKGFSGDHQICFGFCWCALLPVRRAAGKQGLALKMVV